MEVEKILTWLDIVGAGFALVTAGIHAAGLDNTKFGKAVSSVSIDVLGFFKALRGK